MGFNEKMSQPPLTLAILFADISGSTRLYDTLGDKRALEKIDHCLTLLGDVSSRHGGEIIKTIGDEIMCAFPTASSAVTAAMAMQQELTASTSPLHIRIGLHFGEVIREGGDVFGDAVNLAARLTKLAVSDQIMTTRETAETLSAALCADIRQLGQTSVKGKREDIRICEVIWHNDADLTMLPSMLPGRSARAAHHALALDHAGQHLMLTAQHPVFIIGRDNECDLLVNDPLASRRHVRIELYNGKFLLIDQSTNGTYLTQNGKTLFLHREESPLTGAGFFALGHEVDVNSPDAIRYACED